MRRAKKHAQKATKLHMWNIYVTDLCVFVCVGFVIIRRREDTPLSHTWKDTHIWSALLSLSLPHSFYCLSSFLSLSLPLYPFFTVYLPFSLSFLLSNITFPSNIFSLPQCLFFPMNNMNSPDSLLIYFLLFFPHYAAQIQF